MNNITDKGYNPCCSCGVCAVICPNGCISFKHNKDGFYIPIVDDDKCIVCGLCKKVCYKYIKTHAEFKNCFEKKPIYGAWSKDYELLDTAASGGVGHEILKYGVNHGYEVCGVVFDTKANACKHTIATSSDEIKAFKTSKYLQSYTIDAFSKFKSDKKYIVIGTPCQVYGLRQLIKIKKWENNFILIDFFCHGTPSFLLWEKYIEYLRNNLSINELVEINFRSKDVGWHLFSMFIKDINQGIYKNTLQCDLFLVFFLRNTCLNKSCYNCILRLDQCFSDIRIGDFWGDKYTDNDSGVTLTIVNTNKGEWLWEQIKQSLNVDKCTFNDLLNSQPTRFLKKNAYSKKVLHLLKTDKILSEIYNKTLRPNLFHVLGVRVKRVVMSILSRKVL